MDGFDWIDELRYFAYRMFVVVGTAFAVFFVISLVLMLLAACGIYIGG